MKAKIFYLLFMLATVSSCSPKAIGYQNHPLPPAYYPNRCIVHLGPIVFLDVQKP